MAGFDTVFLPAGCLVGGFGSEHLTLAVSHPDVIISDADTG